MTTPSFDGGLYHPVEGMRLSQEQRNALIEALDNSAPKVFELEHLAVPTTGDPLHVRRNIRGQRPTSALVGTLQAARIRNGWFDAAKSVRQHMAETLKRLTKVDHELANAIELLTDSALQFASESDKRFANQSARPLEGLPFRVRDVIDVRGARTTGGSLTRAERPPAERSAEVIRRLMAAGAIPIAKDSTTEFAVGGMHVPLKGPTLNPWDTTRWSGGSSSGTAVSVATRVVPFGIGTDVNGSVRMPAAFCGVTALKPTKGVVRTSGMIPMSWSTEVVGPIAQDAHTIRAVFEVMAAPAISPQHTPSDQVGQTTRSAEVDPATLTLAVPRSTIFQDCDEAVLEGLEDFLATFESIGASIVPQHIPHAELSAEAATQIVAPEAALIHRKNVRNWQQYSSFTQNRLIRGLASRTVDYLRAQQFTADLQNNLYDILGEADVLVIPTVSAAAPTVRDEIMYIKSQPVSAFSHQSRFTAISNITGFPAISFPTGFDQSGCPISTMLIGLPHQEDKLISLVENYQHLTSHHRRLPTGISV